MRRKLSQRKTPRLARVLPLLLILGACATGSIREKVLTLPVIEGAGYVGQATCAECHEGMAAAFAGSVHGRLADFELMGAEKGCESCHGPASLHVEAGDAAKILRFGELAADEAAAVCVRCHSDGGLFEWAHGEHAFADVGCSDCHTMHGKQTAGASLKEAEPQLCYGCHQEQQAKASFPSHHPVKEGKMACSDCHNPHGELQTEEQARDLCLDCHARYQGPFVFEHAPVEEDCGVCHEPHGTVANNLLKQNEPFLCLQCHESHFHATRVGSTTPATNVAFSATNPDGTPSVAPTPGASPLPSGTPAPTGGSTPSAPLGAATVQITNELGEHAWQLAFGTKCTVCHSVVHGSDLPSQSAPSVVDPSAIGSGNGAGQGWPDGGGGLTR